MAQIPSIPDLQNAIIEIFSIFHNDRARPNDGLQWGSIQDEWNSRGYRADDFQRLVELMLKQGTLGEKNGVYFLTDFAVTQGLITLPTIEEIEHAILHQFSIEGVRTGETLIAQHVQQALWEEGITAEQFSNGCKSLMGKNQIETYDGMLRLTEQGFKAM